MSKTRNSKYLKDSTNTNGECFLCGKNSVHTTRFANWSEEAKSFVVRHTHVTPPANTIICKKDYVEAKRYSNDPSYVPKWKHTVSVEVSETKCIYPECNQTSNIIKASFAPPETIRQAVGISSSNDLLFCKGHYNQLYRQLHPPIKCASCQAQAKVGSTFRHYSPDSVTISKYLSDSGTMYSEVQPDDLICLTCYKMHLAILSSFETQHLPVNECLLSDIELWQQTQNDTSSILTKSILEAVITVAKELYQDKAILLTSACAVFLEAYTGERYTESISSLEVYIETGDSTIHFTSRWLLHQLIIHLKNYMDFRCIHKKFGTILYKHGGDLLTSLSWALGTNSHRQPDLIYNISKKATKSCPEVLNQSAELLNDLIHKEISRLATDPFTSDPSNLSVDKFLNDVNSQLTTFLSIATQSIRERHGTFSTLNSQTHSHTKKIRHFFILCCLMYCTNPKQATPLHNILADIVESTAGSRQLIRILNRLGCTSSPDTYDRFVTFHAEHQRYASVWKDLQPSAFTIATVDNFDMLQSHSAVYSGSKERSYHGTTVQLVQPNPQLSFTTSSSSLQTNSLIPSSSSQITCISTHAESSSHDITSTVDDNETHHVVQPTSPVQPLTHRRRYHSSSPSNSPHKLGKDGPKRRRTVVVRQLASSLPTPEIFLVSSPYSHLTLESFQTSPVERLEVEKLNSSIFNYMLQKASCQDLGITLSDIRSFIEPGNTVQCPSYIHYMELVNENPDCEETMLHISENLIDVFQSGAFQEWVIVAGDGKTFQHLAQIKRHYGTVLNKLLIVPGDWHILKNYQLTLMKAYFGAGLGDIAKIAGYRGSTLTSLEKCTNFKRIHNFILQVWEALYTTMLITFIKSQDKQIILDDISQLIQSSIEQKLTSMELISKVDDMTSRMGLKDEFFQFIKTQGDTDNTWKFWVDFVFYHCYAYVALFLSVRGSNWNLRNTSLKSMAPVFAAFDRSFYQRIIPTHLADLLIFPTNVTNFFSAGGFTVHITGEQWKSVGLDEAHEMCINKDMKAAITYPTESYLQKTSLFFNYRIKTSKNFLKQLFPEVSSCDISPKLVICDTSTEQAKKQENISTMITAIVENNLLPSNIEADRGLVNTFTAQEATPEQLHDLLNFKQIGVDATEAYIKHHILGYSSITSTTIRRKKLLTMSASKQKKKRLSPKDRENEKVIKCLQRRLAWCNRTGRSFDAEQEQYSLYPRALADENGVPHSEDERMPSITALWRHWLRTCYICNLWSNSHLSDIYCGLSLPENSGWILNVNGSYLIDWEDPIKQDHIRQNMDYLLSGCGCKKGCTSGKCGCKRKQAFCGPGCVCSGCKNVPEISTINTHSSEIHSSSDSDVSSDDDLETEIITDTDYFMPINVIDI